MTPVDPNELNPKAPPGDPQRDPHLASLLQEWNVPAIPDALDDRVLRSFRQRHPLGFWRRLLTGSIRVPIPVVLGLLLLGLALWVARSPRPAQDASESSEPTRNALGTGPHGVVSRGSLAGFRPVQEISVTVLPQGEAP